MSGKEIIITYFPKLNQSQSSFRLKMFFQVRKLLYSFKKNMGFKKWLNQLLES